MTQNPSFDEIIAYHPGDEIAPRGHQPRHARRESLIARIVRFFTPRSER